MNHFVFSVLGHLPNEIPPYAPTKSCVNQFCISNLHFHPQIKHLKSNFTYFYWNLNILNYNIKRCDSLRYGLRQQINMIYAQYIETARHMIFFFILNAS